MSGNDFRSNFKSEVGVLSVVGYKVGAEGKLISTRRFLLDKVFNENLNTDLYRSQVENIDEWGNPGSSERLCKMANAISSNMANAQSSKKNNSPAIHDWKMDLKWLKEKYYDGKDWGFIWSSYVSE